MGVGYVPNLSSRKFGHTSNLMQFTNLLLANSFTRLRCLQSLEIPKYSKSSSKLFENSKYSFARERVDPLVGRCTDYIEEIIYHEPRIYRGKLI